MPDPPRRRPRSRARCSGDTRRRARAGTSPPRRPRFPRLRAPKGAPEWPARRSAPACARAARPPPSPRALEALDHRDCVARLPVLELDCDELALESTLELFRRSLDDDPAARHDRQPVGELVGLLEVVGRQQDREALLRGQALHLDPHRDARLGVEAGGRLVEEEDARPVDEPERDVEPALHPAGVAAHDPVGRVGEPDELEQLVHALLQLGAAHAVDPALQHQVLAAGGLAVEPRLLGHVAERAPGPVRVPDDVVPGDGRAARVGLRQRREDADGRRLAGSVRAEGTRRQDLASTPPISQQFAGARRRRRAPGSRRTACGGRPRRSRPSRPTSLMVAVSRPRPPAWISRTTVPGQGAVPTLRDSCLGGTVGDHTGGAQGRRGRQGRSAAGSSSSVRC